MSLTSLVLGFVEECVDDLGFWDGLDDFAADEDLALAVASGDAEVGFPRFAGAVDDTAHDNDAQEDTEALECCGDRFGEGVMGAPAPMGTPPTVTWRDARRRGRGELGAAGMSSVRGVIQSPQQ